MVRQRGSTGLWGIERGKQSRWPRRAEGPALNPGARYRETILNFRCSRPPPPSGERRAEKRVRGRWPAAESHLRAHRGAWEAWQSQAVFPGFWDNIFKELSVLPGKQPALGMSAAAAALVLQLHLLVPEDISGTYPAGLNRPSRNGCVSIYTEQCIANTWCLY